ncbi:MAG: 23S rRNA (adenine(2503)-C(2))-methyltransferase RlmN [Deltaproteobacteria bacterium]|nr:23S rRNA (adenine(2503)-C(2))-methyltransferase RlmN [Deltaproteobacteria bacterium]
MKVELKGFNAHETEAWVESQGLKPYQGRQIRHWLFKRLAGSFEEMTDLSKPLRGVLKEWANINHLEKVCAPLSQDGTRKYLFSLSDGHFIEAVLIPEEGHFTLCISSQAGCAMGCRFCLTAKQGFKRDLKASEIIDQVIQVRKSMDNPDRLTNIVLMGMGEPLANYDAVLKAMGNLISTDGMNFSHRKVTLSTCGLVPEIKKLGRDITVNLAISLNAADDKTRSFLMPINRKYPLKSLIAACRDFPLPNRRMITFEYILIENVNEGRQDALKITSLLSGLRAKINLIPLNPHPGAEMSAPSMEKVRRFQEILLKNHFTAIIRKGRGKDIQAACGQLSGTNILLR